MLRSGLGLPPWDVFHQGLAVRIGLTVGVWSILVSFVVLAFWIGIYPRPFFRILAPPVQRLVEQLRVDGTRTATVSPDPGFVEKSEEEGLLTTVSRPETANE